MTQYRKIIGSLMYLMNTRTNICFVVNTLSWYLVKPRRVHWIATKHVMRYLKGMIEFRLYYNRDHGYRLYGYANSDWEGCVAERKSTSGGCYYLGFTMISWFSKKVSSVTLSKTEEEYIAAFSTNCEAIWIKNLMSGLFDMELDTTMIICDNQSYINMTDNPVFYDKSKHIEL